MGRDAPTTCHGWVCDEPTGVESLRWTELPMPSPGPGEALVEVAAASVNFPDLLVVSGKYQWQPTPPFVPGAEYAGTVIGIGDGVTSLAPGDRVMTVGTCGGFGTHAVVPVARLKRIPGGIPFVEASTLLVAYGTAYHGLVDRGALRAGETVLVLGAAGGVGTAAIQVAKAQGARVIAAVSSAEKAARCLALGADEAVDYRADDLRQALKAIVPAGPDVIFDPVGGALAEPAFRSIAWRGRHLVIGFAGGEIPRLPLNLALLKGASLIGVFWGAFDAHEPGPSLSLVAALAEGHAAGWLRPVLDSVEPMATLPAAFERIQTRRVVGKIVLVNEIASPA